MGGVQEGGGEGRRGEGAWGVGVVLSFNFEASY